MAHSLKCMALVQLGYVQVFFSKLCLDCLASGITGRRNNKTIRLINSLIGGKAFYHGILLDNQSVNFPCLSLLAPNWSPPQWWSELAMWNAVLYFNWVGEQHPQKVLQTERAAQAKHWRIFQEEKLKNNDIFGGSLLWLRAVLALYNWSHIKHHYNLIWL